MVLTHDSIIISLVFVWYSTVRVWVAVIEIWDCDFKNRNLGENHGNFKIHRSFEGTKCV